MGEISISLYTTTYVDKSELRVHASAGTVKILIGNGTAGTQQLILPIADAETLIEDIRTAISESERVA